MRQEVTDAIESARTVAHDDNAPMFRWARPLRTHSADKIRALVLAVVRELPEDMTVGELRDELEISERAS